MFRVGFGDFFLLTVPSAGGPKHILIDCGVHAKDIGSIDDAVAQMAKDCGGKLALIIMTHRHADHISGFAKCRNAFKDFTVESVWMPWFENPENKTAMDIQKGLTALANRLRIGLAAMDGEKAKQMSALATNITGDMGTGNQVALDVLHNGFANKPVISYYKAGDAAHLPQSLVDAGLSAQILGPPSDTDLIKQMTNKSQQFLSEAAQTTDRPFQPFNQVYKADPEEIPKEAFHYFSASEIQQMVDDVQPNTLAARAMEADKTINNQSLVVLFGFNGKNLLFVGDAQWGNWENFLYGGKFGDPGHTELTEDAKAILGKIDFYKVGHHGSANATPKGAVGALRFGCCGMCSTQVDAYNQVPREPLLQALSQRMNGQLARSDQVKAETTGAEKDAGPLNALFKAPTGELFIDFEF